MLPIHTLLAAVHALLSQGCRTLSACVVVAMLFSCPAQAYLPGGHYYVLNVMEWTVPPEQRDPYWFLIAYCSELPDLSEELDAVTQRFHVMISPNEHGAWGWSGSCESNVSRHMAISQTYLHALNGADVNTTQRAALETLKAIKGQYEAATPENKSMLACATGFALHLYADAHAHAEMAGDGEGTTARHPHVKPSDCNQSDNTNSNKTTNTMYPTGLGHARDNSVPDYLQTTLHQCGDKPQDWIADLNKYLFNNKANGAPILNAIEKAQKQPDGTDAPVDLALLARMDSKFAENVVTAFDKTGPATRDFTQTIVTSSCDDSLTWLKNNYPRAIPKDVGNGFCHKVWAIYLENAYANFKQRHVGITDNPHIDPGCDVKSLQSIENGKDDTLEMGIGK